VPHDYKLDKILPSACFLACRGTLRKKNWTVAISWRHAGNWSDKSGYTLCSWRCPRLPSQVPDGAARAGVRGGRTGRDIQSFEVSWTGTGWSSDGAGPPDQEIARRRIGALLAIGRVSAALAAAEQLWAEAPGDADRVELLGLCLLRAQRTEEAARLLGQARGSAPEHPHILYLHGFALGQLGQFEPAEEALRMALRLLPEEAIYVRALADLLARLERHEEALALAERAVALGPEESQNHVTLGFVAWAAGRRVLARSAYRQALALEPGDATAWNNLGCIDLDAGDRLAARAHFRAALRLDPAAGRTRRNLGLVVSPRPLEIYSNFHSFLGEALREVVAAGRAGTPLRLLALGQALGGEAVAWALRSRLGSSPLLGQVGTNVGAAAVSALLGSLGTAAAVPLMALGVGWLATARQVTPLRREFAAHVATMRGRWERAHQAWLDGTLSRTAHEAEIDRLLDHLILALAQSQAENPGGPYGPT
jgi:Flp pilus assembly protein TadD